MSWQCPRCGSFVASWITACPACMPLFTPPLCTHDYVGGVDGTLGMRCWKCGESLLVITTIPGTVTCGDVRATGGAT